MRLRAQEWIRRHPEILQERIAAPTVVVGMMRSGTTLLQRLLAADPRFNCAHGWEVVEAAPRLGPSFHRRRSPYRGERSARSQVPRTGAGPVCHSPDVCAGGRRGDRLPGRRVLVTRARVRRTSSALPVLARRAGLHAGLRLPTPDAAVSAVAEAAASSGRHGRPSAGCSSHLPTSAIWTYCGPSSAICTSCTCTATPAPRSPRGPASTPPCMRCMPTASTGSGSARSGCSGWAGPTIARWRCVTVGPTGVCPGHRHRLRRCGRRPDRTSGPGVRRH